MTKSGTALLLWTPRFAGLATAAFLGLFALDAFDGRPLVTALPGFLIHLIPAFLVLAAVAIAWRFPLLGAVAFAGLALTYAITVRWRLGWIAVIGAPLVAVAVLFFVSWRARAAEH
jgi:CHASE2 domain-containing sensor protein